MSVQTMAPSVQPCPFSERLFCTTPLALDAFSLASSPHWPWKILLSIFSRFWKIRADAMASFLLRGRGGVEGGVPEVSHNETDRGTEDDGGGMADHAAAAAVAVVTGARRRTFSLGRSMATACQPIDSVE
jgi:hypothetical protein